MYKMTFASHTEDGAVASWPILGSLPLGLKRRRVGERRTGIGFEKEGEQRSETEAVEEWRSGSREAQRYVVVVVQVWCPCGAAAAAAAAAARMRG
ncbi:hypothetical protein E2C01_060807 [Portunus trituberculatus]|uniref:Uncharacterized protein n=1 Tax=Portunus trituberculatus TaxID=210409 RepID=A0A5B7HBK7_PORTR|nr:hypothetical protein [Portunus trituberculatus]